MEPLRGNDIRQQNEKLVLKIIHKSDGVSQSDVVQRTGLKPPTVFRIFSSLEEAGFIEVFEKKIETGDKKGRRPVYYRINADARYIVGIDFWVGSASVVVVNFAGDPVYKKVTEFPHPLNAGQMVEKLEGLAEEALKQSGVQRSRVLGIGMGAPGRLDIEEGTVLYYGRIPGMRNFSLKAKMEETFGLPVFLHNNAAVVGLSEYRYGVAKDHEALLTVLIRSGVGGSFIHQGDLFVTRNRTTLELGHMLVEANGRPCSCGRRGCLEPYISEEAILSDIAALFPDSGAEQSRTIDKLDSLIETGHPGVLKVLEKKAELLAGGMRSLFQLFGPDSFLIVSRSAALSEYFSSKVSASLCGEPNGTVGDECAVLSCRYDPILAGIGAADLVLDKFFN
jgi:predicted NBD/HSP70 family sugar kinase